MKAGALTVAAVIVGITTAALTWAAVALVEGTAALLDILTLALERTP